MAEGEVARLNLKAGDWHITKTADAGGTLRPVTASVCLADGDPVTHITRAPCNAEDRAIKDGKLTWTIVCNPTSEGAKAVKLTGSGELTGEDSTFSGNTTLQIKTGEKEMLVKTAWSGKRVGECTEKTGAKAKKVAPKAGKKAGKKAATTAATKGPEK
jgi:hypothetical protein